MRTRFVLLVAAFLPSGCAALWTEAPAARDTFDSPLPGLKPELQSLFVLGDENFGRVFTPEEGLGPIFVRASCSHCHIADGRGTPAELVTRFSLGTDLALAVGGDQLQPHAIVGSSPEELPAGVSVSRRLPPPVFGMGLIEAIPDETILALADPDDLDGDGISGRPNLFEGTGSPFVPEAPEGEVGAGSGLLLGRFGLKANFASLVGVVGHAYHQDMGVTNDFVPFEDPGPQSGGVSLGDTVPDPELPASEMLQTVFYVRLLAPPGTGNRTSEVIQGEGLFASLGCATCHVPSLQTGPNVIAPLSEVDVALYSDLLLHDLGPALADERPDRDASGSEFRTKPLWGTRLVREFLDGDAFFLHDGRCPDLDCAILAHGGEASVPRAAYSALPSDDREALRAFVGSL